MSDYYSGSAVASESYDVGLRSFLLGVYNKMGGALLLTALMAFLASVDPLKSLLFTSTTKGVGLTLLGYLVAFGPIVLILCLGFFSRAMDTVRGSAVAFWGVASLFGLSFGTLVMQYTSTSLGLTFLVTSASFGALSLFGYTTKKNLDAIGNFCVVALFGLIIATLISIFLQSTLLHFIITFAGILIFAGLIAWDTQKLKSRYADGHGDGTALKVQSNLAALDLYLDFINLFLLLLRLFGVKKD